MCIYDGIFDVFSQVELKYCAAQFDMDLVVNVVSAEVLKMTKM